MKRLGGVLLAAVLVAGCVGGPARDPGAVRPGAGEPAATVATPPEAPAKTGPGMLQPAPAFVTLGRGCKPGEIERGPAEPTGIASAVSARIFVREDPGVAAPILAWLGELPVTVAVQFDAPVNPATFALTLQDTRCDYLPGPIEQTVLWLSEKEASIHLRALPAGKPGPYTVSFGQGQDQAGREVREPNFRIQLQTDRRRLRVYAVPVATDGEPRLLLDRNAYLHPRSVSPDGRYLLLVRDGSDEHSLVASVAAQIRSVDGLRGDIAAVQQSLTIAQRDINAAMRHVSVVRYDAFGDMGGRLSFSAAILDDNGDGVLLTSIHGHTESRMYVKTVTRLKADGRVSPEELEAITTASPIGS